MRFTVCKEHRKRPRGTENYPLSALKDGRGFCLSTEYGQIMCKDKRKG